MAGRNPSLLLILLSSAIHKAESACTGSESVHFELVTGQVYTAPTDMLDSRPGTLMLTDCIELCLSNSTCQSANFETGLCVLFSSSAQSSPGKPFIYSSCPGKPFIYSFFPGKPFIYSFCPGKPFIYSFFLFVAFNEKSWSNLSKEKSIIIYWKVFSSFIH